MKSSAVITIFFVTIIANLATSFTISEPFSSENETVCDGSALDNITVSVDFHLSSERNVSGNFYSLVNVSSIDAKYLNLSQLCEGMISYFPELTILFFDHGNLMNIEPGTFQRVDKLEIVSFTYNRLTTIQKGVFDPIKSLKEIFLIGNHISNIQQGAFSNMPKLSDISLQDNKLTSLDGNLFNGCHDLKSIYFNQNQIIKIDQNAFNDLKLDKNLWIDLSNNSIQHFDPRSLQNISFPIDLNLEFNKIAEYADIIQNCKLSSSVNLRNNRITDIPKKLIYYLGSRYRNIQVDLRENNLPCDIINRIKDIDYIMRDISGMSLQIC